MLSHILQDLFQRRVPHFLAIYLAVGWGVLEFCGFLVDRYELSPYLVDIALVGLLSMIPTVLVLAYFHGGTGPQKWTRVEKIGVPANLIATATVLVFAFSGKDLSGTASTTTYPGYPVLEPTRIAVLYFDDHSPGQELGYLADGLTEGLIHELSQVEALDVVSRNGVKLFRDGEYTLDSIVRTLEVGSIVEGSIQRSGDRLRATVQLIDAVDGSHLESLSLERPWGELFALQDELAQEVSRFLRKRLGSEIHLRARRAATESVEAWELVQRAESEAKIFDQLRLTADTSAALRALERADSLLAAAEKLDPAWVEPTVLRGWLPVRRAGYGFPPIGPTPESRAPHAEAFRRGVRHADRALGLDGGNPGALELRGTLSYLLWDLSVVSDFRDEERLRAGAERDLRAAIANDPRRASALKTLSDLLRMTGDFDEAMLMAERAYEADAFLTDASDILFFLGQAALDLERHDETMRWCGEGRKRFPEQRAFRTCLLIALGFFDTLEPDVDVAWELAREIAEAGIIPVPGGRPVTDDRAFNRSKAELLVAAVIARKGLADSAKAVLSRAAELGREHDPGRRLTYYEAPVRLVLGEPDEAVRLLTVYLEAYPNEAAYVARDWWFRDLWDHPRFQALLEMHEQPD